MLRHAIRVFKLQGTKELSQHKTLKSRQLQDKFSKTLSRHFQTMSRHNLEKGTEECCDITLQATTKKLEDKQNNVATKMLLRPVFWDP